MNRSKIDRAQAIQRYHDLDMYTAAASEYSPHTNFSPNISER